MTKVVEGVARIEHRRVDTGRPGHRPPAWSVSPATRAARPTRWPTTSNPPRGGRCRRGAGCPRRARRPGPPPPVDDQIASHRAGHRVLDETEEPRLDPVPDQRVGDPQHYFSVFDGQWCNSGQVGLPDGVRHLLTQGFRTRFPQPFGVVHVGLRPCTAGLVHRAIHSCGRAPIGGRPPPVGPGVGRCCDWLPCVICQDKRRVGPDVPYPSIHVLSACCARNGTPCPGGAPLGARLEQGPDCA